VLWHKSNVELSTHLLPLLSRANTPGGLKLSAALAVGYAGNPANDDALVRLLDDPNARPYAALAVLLGGNDAGAKRLLQILPIDHYAEAVIRGAVNNTASDHFNVLIEPMFSSGEIYRRMRVAEILDAGDPTSHVSYGYVWTQLAAGLAAGWSGPAGMSTAAIRAELYASLTGHDAERRRLVAKMLVAMNARGLLLAARDAGIQEARDALRNASRPGSGSL
jgi:hypothetical protein